MFKKALKLSALFFLFFVLSSFIHVLSIGYFHHTWSPLMVIRNYEALKNNPDYSAQQYYVPIDSISPKMVLAVMCAEDQKFPQHNGFDFDAIQKAMEHNQKSDKKKGASTISQQTAKNIFLWQRRDFLRKGLEAYYTVLIELCWSKKRIMESYLNVIEMGDGVYGVEAAARQYYEKNAHELTSSEAASICAILPNPRVFDPHQLRGKPKNEYKRIIRCMPRLKKLLKDIGINEKK